ncbi:glycerophosphodiester phosphodiesterase family protein [Streptomonospora litoralis]|uniref:glycerophosphodiester phosphodiesterase n=1 Tax=Streptomonospora litoralis TaxID=2498135 RepID=A0A4P6PX44_9ACTN|nr:glycerophosphodiester phosphodiesterase family protein [Streptomonospora litoralis]QBI52816.1 Glycerophosphoryl diester phosphodiesterase precursor [Streptomonospora litoralis]
MRRTATAARRLSLTAPVLVLALVAGAAPAAAERHGADHGHGHGHGHGRGHGHGDGHERSGPDALVDTPWVIAHRGASAYRPEHTLSAYRLAIRQRADVIEPDLVPTSDGHLVARHENELSGTTDVADHPEFADRRTTKTIDGNSVTGWFSEDFTLEEIKTLRAVERIPDIRPRNTRFDGRFEIPTFEEVLDTWKRGRRFDRDLQLIPELKHGGYFDSIGLDTEKMLAETLRDHRLDDADSPVIVQSFEPESAREVDERVDTRVVQLISGAQEELTTGEGLDRIAEYADAIGPSLTWVLPVGEHGRAGDPTDLVADAHERGLLVTPYTLRSENAHLPDGYDRGGDPTRYGDFLAYYVAVYRTGVDGVFSDNPDHLRWARDLHLRIERRR